MIETTTVQFTLFAIVLSLLAFFLVTNANAIDFVNNVVSPLKNVPHITVVDYNVIAKFAERGFDPYYDITVNTKLVLNKQEKATTIVPVILYKGAEKRMQVSGISGDSDTFTIKSGEEIPAQVLTAQIPSAIPPLKKLSNPSGTFTFDQRTPYYVEDPESLQRFRIYLNQVKEYGEDGNIVCKAQFIAECKKTIDPSKELNKCEDLSSPDETCRDELELCGAIISIIAKDVKCSGEATISYETDCSLCKAEQDPWSVEETAIIYFFKIDPDNPTSSCVYKEENRFEQECYPDFLGSQIIKFDPSIIQRI